MKMRIEFAMDNAAFSEDLKTETILVLSGIGRQLHAVLFDKTSTRPVYDTNGNKIGSWEISK